MFKIVYVYKMNIYNKFEVINLFELLKIVIEFGMIIFDELV